MKFKSHQRVCQLWLMSLFPAGKSGSDKCPSRSAIHYESEGAMFQLRIPRWSSWKTLLQAAAITQAWHGCQQSCPRLGPHWVKRVKACFWLRKPAPPTPYWYYPCEVSLDTLHKPDKPRASWASSQSIQDQDCRTDRHEEVRSCCQAEEAETQRAGGREEGEVLGALRGGGDWAPQRLPVWPGHPRSRPITWQALLS